MIRPPGLFLPSRRLSTGLFRRERSLRTPRRVLPRWMRYPETCAAGDLVQVGPDGKIRVNAGAIVVSGNSDDCCCSEGSTPGVPCIHCGASTPKYYAVTFSGISWNTGGCVNCRCIATDPGCFQEHSTIRDGNPNATYIVTQITSCVWRFVGSGLPAQGCIRFVTACGGTPSCMDQGPPDCGTTTGGCNTYGPGVITIYLTRFSFPTYGYTLTFDVTTSAQLFSGTVTGLTSNCLASFSITNSYTGPHGGDPCSPSRGGSATIAPA